jgi:hypothetical protein
VTAAAPDEHPYPRRTPRWLEPSIWLLGVLLFGAIALSAATGLLASVRATIEAQNVRATVAAVVAVVLMVLAAIVWLIGIGFVARWRGRRWALATGLGATVVVRLILVIGIHAPIVGGGAASVNGDGAALYAEALGIASGGRVPGDWAIGYPALLGGAIGLVGAHGWLDPAIDVLISLVVAAVGFDLLWRAGGVQVAAAGIGLFAIMPSQALLVPAFGPDLAYAALVLLAVWLVVAAPKSSPPRIGRRRIPHGAWTTACASAAGLLLGMSQLLRPTSIALLPAFVILALLVLRSSHPQRGATALVVAFLVALSPVIVDNVGRHGVLSLEPTSYAGWRLYVGTDAASSVDGGLNDLDPDGLDAFPGATTRARSDAAGRAAFDHVLAAPGAFLDLAGTKFAGLWSDDAYAATLALAGADEAQRGLLIALQLASQLAWAFVALAAAWGLARSWPLPGVLLSAVLVVAALAVLHAALASEPRDHAVVMPLLLAAAATGLAGPLRRPPPEGDAAP